jgi:hypothetical protein
VQTQRSVTMRTLQEYTRLKARVESPSSAVSGHRGAF